MQCSNEQIRLLAGAGVLVSFVLFLEDSSSDLSIQENGLDTAMALVERDMGAFKDTGIDKHCIQMIQLHPSVRPRGISLLKTMARDKAYRESIFAGLDVVLAIMEEACDLDLCLDCCDTIFFLSYHLEKTQEAPEFETIVEKIVAVVFHVMKTHRNNRVVQERLIGILYSMTFDDRLAIALASKVSRLHSICCAINATPESKIFGLYLFRDIFDCKEALERLKVIKPTEQYELWCTMKHRLDELGLECTDICLQIDQLQLECMSSLSPQENRTVKSLFKSCEEKHSDDSDPCADHVNFYLENALILLEAPTKRLETFESCGNEPDFHKKRQELKIRLEEFRQELEVKEKKLQEATSTLEMKQDEINHLKVQLEETMEDRDQYQDLHQGVVVELQSEIDGLKLQLDGDRNLHQVALFKSDKRLKELETEREIIEKENRQLVSGLRNEIDVLHSESRDTARVNEQLQLQLSEARDQRVGRETYIEQLQLELKSAMVDRDDQQQGVVVRYQQQLQQCRDELTQMYQIDRQELIEKLGMERERMQEEYQDKLDEAIDVYKVKSQGLHHNVEWLETQHQLDLERTAMLSEEIHSLSCIRRPIKMKYENLMDSLRFTVEKDRNIYAKQLSSYAQDFNMKLKALQRSSDRVHELECMRLEDTAQEMQQQRQRSAMSQKLEALLDANKKLVKRNRLLKKQLNQTEKKAEIKKSYSPAQSQILFDELYQRLQRKSKIITSYNVFHLFLISHIDDMNLSVQKIKIIVHRITQTYSSSTCKFEVKRPAFESIIQHLATQKFKSRSPNDATYQLVSRLLSRINSRVLHHTDSAVEFIRSNSITTSMPFTAMLEMLSVLEREKKVLLVGYFCVTLS